MRTQTNKNYSKIPKNSKFYIRMLSSVTAEHIIHRFYTNSNAAQDYKFFRSHASDGVDVQRRHSSPCCAFFLSSPYPPSIIQSMSFCLGLPLPLQSSLQYLSLTIHY